MVEQGYRSFDFTEFDSSHRIAGRDPKSSCSRSFAHYLRSRRSFASEDLFFDMAKRQYRSPAKR